MAKDDSRAQPSCAPLSPQALQVWAVVWFSSGLSRCGSGAADSSKISFQHQKQIHAGSVGELSSSGEGGQRDFRRRKGGWEESVGPWDRRATARMGNLEGEWVCDVQLWWGSGQEIEKPVRGGEAQDEWSPSASSNAQHPPGPAGTGWSHLQCCKKLFLPQPLLLTPCSSKAAGKGENGKEGKNSCQRYQMETVIGPSPLLWTLSPSDATWGKSCRSRSCTILMLRWTHCSDRAAVPEGLEIYGAHVLEIQSLGNPKEWSDALHGLSC